MAIEEVKLTKYKCPFCGKLYDMESEAEKCYAKHSEQIQEFQSIKGKWYKSVYGDYEGPSIIHLYKFLDLTPEGIVYLEINEHDEISKNIKQINRSVKDIFRDVTNLNCVNTEPVDKEYMNKKLFVITEKVRKINQLLEEAKQ